VCYVCVYLNWISMCVCVCARSRLAVAACFNSGQLEQAYQHMRGLLFKVSVALL
jgi:hypothetical protein